MILVGDGSAEKSEDAIAGGLNNVAAVATTPVRFLQVWNVC